MTRIICLWEAPRSRGTSISFALSNGLKAGGFNCVYLDEPFHWRKLRQVEEQGSVAATQDYVQKIKTPHASAADFIIQKEQAKWLFDYRTKPFVGSDFDWVKGYTNVVLLRDAREMVTSHHKKVTFEGRALDMKAIGIRQLFEVYNLLNSTGQSFIVVDTGELLVDPEKGMQKFCDKLKIPYSKGMIEWHTPDIEVPPWGQHWYDDVIKSDGLRRYIPSTGNASNLGDPEAFIGETQVYIEKMRPMRLRFDNVADTRLA